MTIALVLAQIQFHNREGAGGCVADNGFCPGWIADNIDKYVSPLLEHIFLTVVSLAIGFAIAFALALLAHRRRWLTGPIIGVTGALYTVPSVAAFFLLLPITGRGNLTAIVALVAYTLLILFRNITTGLRNVPADVVDSARGMGLTDGQVLRQVELPLALPEILAGVRIAFTTTVGLATLAFFAGGGGLGEYIYSSNAGTGGLFFKSNVVVAGGLAVLLAAFGDLLILTNTYVGVSQVDPETVAAARGMGLTETQIVRKVELPLAINTIFAGLRLSAVAVVATATIAPLANVQSLGNPIIEAQTYGTGGTLGAAIFVALITLIIDAGLGLIQRIVTPKGLTMSSSAGPRRRSFFTLTARSETS